MQTKVDALVRIHDAYNADVPDQVVLELTKRMIEETFRNATVEIVEILITRTNDIDRKET